MTTIGTNMLRAVTLVKRSERTFSQAKQLETCGLPGGTDNRAKSLEFLETVGAHTSASSLCLLLNHIDNVPFDGFRAKVGKALDTPRHRRHSIQSRPNSQTLRFTVSSRRQQTFFVETHIAVVAHVSASILCILDIQSNTWTTCHGTDSMRK